MLAFLERQNVDPKRVTIFVADKKEQQLYQEALKGCPYQNLVVGKPGIAEIRNFIRLHYKENTPVISLDDDLEEFVKLEGEDIVPIGEGEFLKIIKDGFNSAREHSAYLWGISASSNPFYMSETIAVGPYFIMGAFFGTIVRHDKELLVTTHMKEDWERSTQHFVKDGRVVRYSSYALKVDYNGLEGGQESLRSLKNQEDSAKYLVAKYPRLLRLYYRTVKRGKTAGHAEVRFIDEE